MYPKLLTLYGPFELNSYNTAIMIGIAVFMYLARRHPARAQVIHSHTFTNLCIESALAGIVGGRILHILSCLSEYPTLISMIRLWDGGLSILGAFFGILLFSSWRLWSLEIPFAPVADIAALYAPLTQSISRIGCFLVGCCHGAPTESIFSVTYTHPQVLAPLHIPLHPSQLYSSFLFLCLFIGLSLYHARYKPRVGTITLLYIMGMSLERFLVDFIRGDRIMIALLPHLSFHQVVAAAIFIGAGVIMLVRQRALGTYESF